MGSSLSVGLVGKNGFLAFDEGNFSFAKLKREKAVEFLLLQFDEELRDVVGGEDHKATSISETALPPDAPLRASTFVIHHLRRELAPHL
jgi:hypothetical protein